jgi:hypothetical protein
VGKFNEIIHEQPSEFCSDKLYYSLKLIVNNASDLANQNAKKHYLLKLY